MDIFALDAGNKQSGWVLYDSKSNRVVEKGIEDNFTVKHKMISLKNRMCADVFVYEWIGYMGMSVGASVFETCREIGRFIEMWANDKTAYPIMRREVKITLCGSMRAKDKNVRQAIIDRFPAEGGGKVPQIGTKNEQGSLYGMKSHMWSALAVALTYIEIDKEKRFGDGEQAGETGLCQKDIAR